MQSTPGARERQICQQIGFSGTKDQDVDSRLPCLFGQDLRDHFHWTDPGIQRHNFDGHALARKPLREHLKLVIPQ